MVQFRFLLASLLLTFMVACGGGATKDSSASADASAPTETMEHKTDPNEYDPDRGEGKFTEENIKLDATLDKAMADRGHEIQKVKCSACHKLTDEKLVGPGWKGVTERQKPWWIMNFITNPDEMIDKDPVLQAQLELCLVRMPNQNLTDDQARDILEFMRENDGVK